MDLTDIWIGWIPKNVAGHRIIDEYLEETACKICGRKMHPDLDLDLYTTVDCWWVCLECGDRHVPELAAWVRTYRELRRKRDALEKLKEDEPGSVH